MRKTTKKYILDLLMDEKNDIRNSTFGGRTSDQAKLWEQEINEQLKEINEIIKDFSDNT